MWHVETDFFAMAIFLIMLIKEHIQRKTERDVQGNAFYLVLIFSIINDTIDITKSWTSQKGRIRRTSQNGISLPDEP